MKNGPVIRTKYLSYLFRVDQLNFKAEAECCAQFRNQVISPLSMRTKRDPIRSDCVDREIDELCQ